MRTLKTFESFLFEGKDEKEMKDKKVKKEKCPDCGKKKCICPKDDDKDDDDKKDK